MKEPSKWNTTGGDWGKHLFKTVSATSENASTEGVVTMETGGLFNGTF